MWPPKVFETVITAIKIAATIIIYSSVTLLFKLVKFKKSYPIYFKEINLVEISRNRKVLNDNEI